MSLGLNITVLYLISVWPSVVFLNFCRLFVTRVMLISYNICKDKINMHKVQHMSLSFVFFERKIHLGIQFIK